MVLAVDADYATLRKFSGAALQKCTYMVSLQDLLPVPGQQCSPNVESDQASSSDDEEVVVLPAGEPNETGGFEFVSTSGQNNPQKSEGSPPL